MAGRPGLFEVIAIPNTVKPLREALHRLLAQGVYKELSR
jgi:hypothetical protein